MCSRLLLVTEEHLCGGRWAPALRVSADPMAPLEHFKKHIVQFFFPSSLQLSFKMWARKSWSLYLCLQKLDKTPPPNLYQILYWKDYTGTMSVMGGEEKKMMQENHMCLCVSPQPWSCVLLSPSPHAQLSTDQSLGGNWVPLAISCSFPDSLLSMLPQYYTPQRLRLVCSQSTHQ